LVASGDSAPSTIGSSSPDAISWRISFGLIGHGVPSTCLQLGWLRPAFRAAL
jgi:hypothetical protein